jgi:hypothetical protein
VHAVVGKSEKNEWYTLITQASTGTSGKASMYGQPVLVYLLEV